MTLHPSYTFFFFFNDTATTEIYTLSLHDALPISPASGGSADARTSRPPETAPPAAAAAARPLRPRRGARGHQEEARRNHPGGARGDQRPPRRDGGGAEARRAPHAPPGPGRPHPRAASP